MRRLSRAFTQLRGSLLLRQDRPFGVAQAGTSGYSRHLSSFEHKEGNPFEHMQNLFHQWISKSAVKDLYASRDQSSLVITVSGDQLTGKSSLAKALSQHYQNCRNLGAGTIFRQEAARRNVSVGELSRCAAEDPAIDVGIEHRVCSLLCDGFVDDDHRNSCTTDQASGRAPVLVLEGRQTGVMATYVKQYLEKRRVIRVYLSCRPLSQALRLIERTSLELYQKLAPRIEQTLAQRHGGDVSSVGMNEVCEVLRKLNEEEDNGDNNVIEQTCTHLLDNEARDSTDVARLTELYALPDDLNYRNMKLYDVVVDTEGLTKSQKEAKAIAAIAAVIDELNE